AYDPTAQEDPDVKSPAAQRDVGGLGIYLTREFSDSIDYKRVGEANVLKVGINAKNKKLKK
ncbi:MAG: ATP-binding protein, partial [Candidatus Ancillula sp.]|nr:ATP-binding protein [Candidatus Ancillula sp.]